MELHEKLSSLRRRKGLTQVKLAKQIKIARQTVSRWETGASIPTAENLNYLCRFYGVPADYLFGNEAEKPAKGEDPPEAEKPAKGEDPPEAEKPAKGEDPPEAEKPAKEEAAPEAEKNAALAEARKWKRRTLALCAVIALVLFFLGAYSIGYSVGKVDGSRETFHVSLGDIEGEEVDTSCDETFHIETGW
ncbi:MAG: helix-turn-helix domain-containing protein [Dysosmobacter sp.]|nr:helix-turn-helix domain-containing protein [Dysosmobacter sp.]